MTSRGLVGILLAGGLSRRFGSDKLLHPLPDGTPIAVAAARNLKQSGLHCISVLRPEQQALSQLLQGEGFGIHYDHTAEQGMGHSLAAAVRATPAASGWLVALADMPFITPTTISLLTYALRGGASLAAPFYNGRRGHPVGFARPWFARLSSLQGDAGARELLSGHADLMLHVPCNDPGILVDIDTPQGLASGSMAPNADRMPAVAAAALCRKRCPKLSNDAGAK
ncbi:nucleotidyltransferase family protein [Quatrionicoccus australiensis]|uniref:nucleotidyltransferase family protein n=1 Tax=Quatrionicoccus australiensis TaxID=138118 RepID=UPI001CFA93F2|nr:nucleotidyltransferase family protein [Quatrionicoccus australiensis]MCB4358830.1 nucleotidyltransferase family protein [Quatrionicoccus australiensis]